ncbi:hypothetical protein LMG24235_04492 [Paraburkholderia sabiae]|uniref:Uncharacterized protein n=1 Tax=Paraburkholderia sabiae TaxID=273251 RepID=A0ABU9QMF8_9BURK|nr:hypothetical protein [Paraburkholderia sabiae]WJZ77327.1 hypothetical protein QEN71_35235 [Paraburkholderia sabiae]CAD6547842.1 hypothetical protein LMG24235_04492 [Paraburkholderia sabiae]
MERFRIFEAARKIDPCAKLEKVVNQCRIATRKNDRDDPERLFFCLTVERALYLLAKPALGRLVADADGARFSLPEPGGQFLLSTVAGNEHPFVQPDTELPVIVEFAGKLVDERGVDVRVTQKYIESLEFLGIRHRLAAYGKIQSKMRFAHAMAAWHAKRDVLSVGQNGATAG